jgi:hypothetical protein
MRQCRRAALNDRGLERPKFYRSTTGHLLALSNGPGRGGIPLGEAPGGMSAVDLIRAIFIGAVFQRLVGDGIWRDGGVAEERANVGQRRWKGLMLEAVALDAQGNAGDGVSGIDCGARGIKSAHQRHGDDGVDVGEERNAVLAMLLFGLFDQSAHGSQLACVPRVQAVLECLSEEALTISHPGFWVQVADEPLAVGG